VCRKKKRPSTVLRENRRREEMGMGARSGKRGEGWGVGEEKSPKSPFRIRKKVGEEGTGEEHTQQKDGNTVVEVRE